jgi:DNA-directed RNA polymerase subunit RPC12/RpoP
MDLYIMRFFGKKFECDQCKLKFSKNEELIDHARHVHHQHVTKCVDCGKEFIHEEDRLHHSRKEHEKKMERRRQKN